MPIFSRGPIKFPKVEIKDSWMKRLLGALKGPKPEKGPERRVDPQVPRYTQLPEKVRVRGPSGRSVVARVAHYDPDMGPQGMVMLPDGSRFEAEREPRRWSRELGSELGLGRQPAALVRHGNEFYLLIREGIMDFRTWLMREDWQQEMFAGQEEDWEDLQRWTKQLTDSTGDVYSVAVKGDVEGYEDAREADMFVLYINGDEITEGDLPEIKQRIRQIAREAGEYLD